MTFRVLVLCWLGNICSAKIAQGSARIPAGGTVFLSKFCFDFDRNRTAGFFNITLRSLMPAGNRSAAGRSGIELVLFDDQASSYPRASPSWNALSCSQKLAHARFQQFVPATVGKAQDFTTFVPMVERVRPRWWYVALADCSNSSYSVDYMVHTWNPLHNWQSELSVDHYGAWYASTVFGIAYCTLAVAQSHANYLNKASGKDAHPLVRILTSGISCGACAMLLLVGHYLLYAFDGKGFLVFWVSAKLCQTSSKFLLMSILLLVSQGRCISHVMTTHDVWRLFKVLGPFMLVCLTLEMWGEFAQSRTYTTDFVYSTCFGKALVLVDVCLLIVYAVNLQASYQSERNAIKRHFYRFWGCMYCGWFLLLPATVCLAQVLSPWVRFKIVFAVSGASQVVAYAGLVAGLWPTRQQSYFALDATELVALESPCMYEPIPG